MPYHRFWLLLTLFLLGTVVAMNLPDPTRKTDMLIIAPHPDDAVLCCAGVIQQARARGETVRVVNVTDGDGYRLAAAKRLHKLAIDLTPQDMQRFGRIRKKEEQKAFQLLGLDHTHLHFLGFPDGWLEEVYYNTGSVPVVSPFTKQIRTENGSPFTHTGFVSDITDILTKYRPANLYIPSAHDDALDHQVTYHAAMEGINRIGFTGMLRTYVIHTDAPMSSVSATVPLTPKQQEKKRKAIQRYRTQLSADTGFLPSFAQPEERFY